MRQNPCLHVFPCADGYNFFILMRIRGEVRHVAKSRSDFTLLQG